MGRRFLILITLLALAPAAVALGARPASTSWAQPQIVAVTKAGILGSDPSTFRPDDPLTQSAAATLVSALMHKQLIPPAKPTATVTMAGLDSKLVNALGLADSGRSFAAGARSAGLKPPSRFGTEVVARLLGLRTNHPASQDALELRPTDPATRAEAAFSAAQILRFRGWEAQRTLDSAATFAPPPLDDWQRQILQTAISLIGYPYVWGGESETTSSLYGPQVRGGFDCSGFVWRVYKLQAYAGAEQLAGTLRGRTTYQMSGEVPRSLRIPFAKLAPADVLFWGTHGARSKPAEVDHMGIYLGSGWFIHSSGNGVAIEPLSGWYRTRFAWARRPLAEAGLVPQV
ncbi:MAG: peptidoglycan DL-endopeptidase CwlO [Gaiellaceae bacterium]|jgi:cell wall-associated NlpC family hydrolase|nr:peptidoglycan DL-endopeptidase CwlO [Gaiellaceae bacterium]